MNIIEAEDLVKGLPDQALFQEAQFPSGRIPQFLAVSEVQRRQDMRQRFQAAQQGQQATVKDQILQGGIGSTGMAPEMTSAPPMAPQMPPQGAPMPPQMPPPMGMAMGGQVPYRMQEGRSVPDFLNSLTPNFILEARQANRERMAGVIPNRANEQDVVAQAKALAQSGRVEEAAALLRDAGISPAQVIRPPAAVATTPPMEAAVMTRGPLTRGAVSPQVSPAPVASMTPPPMEAAVASQATPAATPPRPRLGTEATSSQVLFPGDTFAAPPAATDPYAQRFDNLLSRLPQVYESVQGIMPQGGGINMAELQKFAPTQADYISPELAAKRDQLQSQLQEMGRSRRAEDIALAQRYLSEAESPIKQAQDEARKSAIASTLMRLGAGVMSGRPEQGLASAAESVESIMSRAREQASAERRAARQDFRTAERAATQAERSTSDAAFQLQAQNITADENKQREFVRDQKQFAQFVFTELRNQGRESRQAQESAVRLSIGIAQSIEQAIDQATREANISDRQYAQSFSTIYKEVLATIKDGGVDAEGNEISYTPEQMLEVAKSKTGELLRSQGIYSPSSVVNVTTPNELNSLSKGQRYRGPDGVVRIKP